jgi:hypothetical protein
MFPVVPAQQSRQHRANETKDRSEVRDDLQSRSKNCPQWCPGYFENPKTGQPQECDCDRILDLCDRPILQGKTGDVNVLSGIHVRARRKTGCAELAILCDPAALIVAALTSSFSFFFLFFFFQHAQN